MADQPIASDATLEDVVGQLSKPEDYIRRVLENMLRCKKQNNSAYLRLGVLGTGQIPNYRIEYLGKAGKITAGITGKQEAKIVFGAFNGRNHIEMVGIGDYDIDQLFAGEERPERVLHYGHWSEKAMTVEEVQGLLGQIRQFKKRK